MENKLIEVKAGVRIKFVTLQHLGQLFTLSREIDRGGAGTDRPIGIIGW